VSRAAPPTAAGDGGVELSRVRTKAVLSLVLLLLISTFASVLVLRQVLLSRIDQDADETLSAHVDSFEKTLAASGDRSLQRSMKAYLAREESSSDEAIVAFIGGKPAAVAQGSPTPLAQALAPLSDATDRTEGDLQTPLGEARYLTLPVQAGGAAGVLAAATLVEDDRNEVASAVQLAAVIGGVVIVLSAAFMWIAVGRALSPLRSLASTTRAISRTDLSRRVEVSGNDELAELGRTFNQMLDRLEVAFAEQREFLADVEHELRTPITVIGGYLDLFEQSTGEEREEAMVVIREELGRMNRLVDDLLLLARSDRPDFLRPERLDVDLLTKELFGKARLLGERRWVLEGVGHGVLTADPHRLTSAVLNLAQNAVRHTRADQVIALGSEQSAEWTRLWVRDEGPGIAPDEQERIFERFHRGGTGEEHAGPGAGLGLAIVGAVAEAHGGRVELDSAPGRGSSFVIILPTSGPVMGTAAREE
jgi:signal transduction histidine kinase